MEPQICRFCLKAGLLCSLFATHPETSLQFSSMLDFCTSVQIDADDDLPSAICENCAANLLKFYNFKKMLMESEQKLRESLLATEVEIKTEVDEEVTNEKLNGTKGAKGHECEICGTVLKSLSNYSRHKKTHSGEKPYSCEACGKTFTRSDDLEQHKRMHTGENLVRCDFCDKTFLKASNLARHRLIHTESKQYTCQLCHKSFHREPDLYTHIRFHTGERPFQCQTCSNSFVTSSDLTVHIRVHTGERPFKCVFCDKRFVTRSALSRHERNHKGAECSVCGEKFVGKKQLKVHMDAH